MQNTRQPVKSYYMDTNIYLTPSLSKGEGVATLRSLKCTWFRSTHVSEGKVLNFVALSTQCN